MHLPSKLLLASALAELLGAAPVSAGALPPPELSLRKVLPAWDPRMQVIRRALAHAALTGRDTVFKNSTSISKSFDGATLFDAPISVHGPGDPEVDISVVCVNCYVTGQATAELNVAGNFNASGNISALAHSFESDVSNITTRIIDDITATVKNDTEDLAHLDFGALHWPTIDADFALAVQSIPECQLTFTFDDLELYLQTQTNISGAATYSLNLFTSKSEVGIRVSNDLELGIVLTVDLIMSIDGSIEVESGFHVRMNNGLALVLDFFGNNVSHITFNGGQFEFLPISIDAEATINAILRVGVHTGVELISSEFTVDGVHLGQYGAGVETILFADIANITLGIAGGNNEFGGCDLAAEEIFDFGIGAAAGASVAFGDFSWGAGPTSLLPVLYTTLSQCAHHVTATATTAAAAAKTTTTGAVARRAATTSSLTTTTLSTTFTHAAVGCRSAGLANCPASLQTTAITTSASTITTVVPSGQKTATWPNPPTADTVTRTVAFGTGAKTMALSVSGTPSAFTPGATATGITIGGHHLTPKEEHIAIGVSVGLGVPLIAGILAGIFFLVKCRKQQRQPAQKADQSLATSVEQVVVEVTPK